MATNFYKQGGSYYTSAGKKISNMAELQSLSKLGGKEIKTNAAGEWLGGSASDIASWQANNQTYNPQAHTIPSGMTPISGTTYGTKELQQANFNNIQPIGNTLYGVPKIPTSLSQSNITSGSNIPTATELPTTYDPNSFVSSSKAYFDQVMKDYQTSKDDAAKLQEQQLNQRGTISKLMNTIGAKGTDYQNQLNNLGVTENTNQLQELNKQIAAANAVFDKGVAALPGQGRGITTGILSGQERQIRNQQAAEVGALTSMAQALQGNIELAYKTAEQAVNLKYEPLENQLKQELQQLDFIYQDLSTAEKKKADAQATLLTERLRLITEQKDNETQINNIALEAAKNGADVNTINKIRNSKTIGEAIANSGNLLAAEEWVGIADPITGKIVSVNKKTGEQRIGGVSNTVKIGTPVGKINGLDAYDTRTSNPGVTRANRNNNPGNIKLSDYTKNFEGVIGVEKDPAQDGGNFLIFDSAESGINAIGRLLLEGKSYKGVTAEQAIKRYNGNGSYGAADLGLDPNKDFQSQIKNSNILKQVATSIAQAEGFTGGQQTNEELSTDSITWANAINNGTATLKDVPTFPKNLQTEVMKQYEKLSGKTPTMAQQNKEEAQKLADELINDPSIKFATGWQAWQSAIPASSAKTFKKKTDRLVGLLTLDAIKLMKGFGSLSNAEGTRLENSRAILNDRWLSTSDYLAELKRVAEVLKTVTINGSGQGSQTVIDLGNGQTATIEQ